ncbi:unnamed protein product [Phytophthora lilii]|uniref:Kinesin-like protein n=1 Tax=Phytophthora lilii TaxID=2077276 RepID=A0A9W6TLL0_9STRA|nr:unnamed protein product [Phytophthora lilii]
MATKSSKNDECVRVMVRIRPMSGKEVQDGRQEVTTANFDRAEVSIVNPVAASSEPPKSFTFDAAFGAQSTQQQVYDTAATEIVEAVMEGYNGTIFAYGQTGAGKSHTMEGYGDQPEIRDLLSKDPKNALDLKENADSGVYVKGLTAQVVKDAAEIDHVMQTGKKNRSVGATLMNQTSSRSHSIFTIVVECLSEGSAGGDGKDHVCVGKLNLVDLAGSERQSKTGATGDRLQEANKINLSLSALGNVISALVDGKSKHIPYRDSKLTRLLQDSLGGNTKTVMIANCGPADYNYEETLTTLRYASRAKNIKNKPKINEDPKDAMIREFQEEIEALKAKLLAIEKQASEGVSSADGSVGGGEGAATSAAPVEIVEVEKIVEKIVIEKGISIEEAQAIAEKAQREKEEMLQKTRDDLALAAKDKAQAELNKRELELKLERERQQAEELAAQQKALLDRLAATQAKVLIGGEMMTKAAQQEDELRRTKLELEERKRQELKLARELAEQEESNLMREEKYQSLQEEAEAKARKLKKVYTKVKEVLGDVKAMEKVHSREREDLLDTIRQLTAQLKLKSLVLDYFMPPAAVAMLEARARWNDEEDDFTLDRLELAGNTLRPRQRPPSASSVRRPETSSSDKSRAAKKFVMAPQNDDEDDEIARAEELELARNPFFMYVSDNEGDGYAPAASRKKQPASSSGSSSRPKTAKKSSSKSSSKRPETASSKRRSEKAHA